MRFLYLESNQLSYSQRTGVFLASADDSFLTATYSTIASDFGRHSDAAWLLMAYNIGCCYALPVVSQFLAEAFSGSRCLEPRSLGLSLVILHHPW